MVRSDLDLLELCAFLWFHFRVEVLSNGVYDVGKRFLFGGSLRPATR
jgi:hypothetical protein